MGLLGAILGKKRVQIISGGSTVIQLDCSYRETHSREARPTKFPIENGQQISDHIIISPFELELEGIITDTPIGTAGQLITQAATTVTSSLTPPVGLITAAAGAALFSALQGSASPSVAAFTQLLSIQQLRQPVTIMTSLARYENMWMGPLTVPRDAQTGQSIVFTVKFYEMILVTPQSVNVAIFANAGLSAALANTGEQDPAFSQRFAQGNNTAVSLVGAGQMISPNGIAGGVK